MSVSLSQVLVGLVGLEHIYIFALEFFMFGTKTFNRTFGMKHEDLEALKKTPWADRYVLLNLNFSFPFLAFQVTKGTQADLDSANFSSLKVLFQNQGWYNLVLAVGTIWGLLHPNAEFGNQLQKFFTGSVISCAIIGGLYAKPAILLTQGGPAILAFAALCLGY